MYAQIVFPIASFKSFTYKIPEKLINKVIIGSAVNAKFRQNIAIGYVISLSNSTHYKGNLNHIDSINTDTFSISKNLWKTIIWMSKYYMAPLGLCIKSALPVSFYKENFSSKKLHISLADNYLEVITNTNISKAEQSLINKLEVSSKSIAASTLKKSIKNIYYWIDKLVKKKIIVREYPSEYENKIEYKSNDIILSPAQQKVFNNIIPFIRDKNHKSFLLNGIPGSGKTEIYVKLAQDTITLGRTVIVLIPEIILTAQMKQRFIKYFGDIVSIWHSKMTRKEKHETIKRINSGSCKIIVGARSCIFAPLQNLGLIIVDEEQDGSYKQDSPKPFYNARDIALVRSKFSNCPTLLTSATPSIESYHNTLINKIELLNLNEKYYKSKSPVIELVDLLNPYNKDLNDRIISPQLMKAIKETLAENKQCLLLNNRRGYASTVYSKSQNDSVQCKNCSIPLSFHSSMNKLMCHYCDHHIPFDYNTNTDDNDEIILKGYGTEKVQEILEKNIPKAKIQRIDSDSIRKKSHLYSILNDFECGKIDILIGTQMISKGLDFDNVQLVGVINADYGMFIPDFRAGEKTYQIISQVIGRSGRRDKQGRAIIQTYNPWDNNLQYAINNKSSDFYSYNLSERQELMYPPFGRLCRVTFTGKDYDATYKIAKMITKKLCNKNFVRVLGPSEAPLSKIKNKWRFTTLIIANKNNPMEIQEHIGITFKTGTNIINKGYKNINIKFDMDPHNML